METLFWVQRGGFTERLTPFRAWLPLPSPQIPRISMCLCSSRAASQRDARVPAGCWYSTVLTVPLGTITVLAAMAEITPVTAPKPGHLAPSFFLSLSLLHPSNACSPEGLSPCGLRLRWMLLYIYISNNGLIREGFSRGSDQASYQRRSISNHYTHVKLQVEQARTWKHHSLQARNYRAILFFLFSRSS